VLDDRAGATVLVELLDPWRSLVAATTVSTQGAIARLLGRLATILGERDRAREYFEQALDVNGRLGARFWIAMTQLDYAGLLASGDEPDRARARDRAAAALEAARQFGYPAIEQRATRLLDKSERG
jgi:tetratricopeptide (TPR) repeat protein